MKKRVLTIMMSTVMVASILVGCGGQTVATPVEEVEEVTETSTWEFDPYVEYTGYYYEDAYGDKASNASLYALLQSYADSQGLTNIGFEELSEEDFMEWLDNKFGGEEAMEAYISRGESEYPQNANKDGFRHSIVFYLSCCILTSNPVADEYIAFVCTGTWTPEMHEGDYMTDFDLTADYTYESGNVLGFRKK